MPDILDAFAKFGTVLELPALINQELRHPMRQFAIFRNTPWTGWQVERLLLDFGVKVWGRDFDANHLKFSVPAHQANWAEYVLYRHGAPVATLYNPANINAQGRGPIPSWHRELPPHDLGGWICTLLDAITGN